MSNYKGRRPGTRRIVIWHKGKSHEWIVEGTKRDGDAFEARKRLELKDRPDDRRTSPLISLLCDQYGSHAARELKAESWRRSRIYQLARVRRELGAVRSDELTAAVIEEFKARRLLTVKAGTLNNELHALSAVLRWARTAGYPVSSVKLVPARNRARARCAVWNDDELQRIFTAARAVSVKFLPMLIFGVNTGMRKGEIIAAEWSWIDESRGLICVPSTAEWSPKSGRAREIPLGDAVKAALAGEREHPRWIFPARGGRRRESWPEEWFDKAMAIAGTSGNPHMLRHTFASHFLRKVPDLFLLSKILGHSHTQTTEMYAHLLPDHLERGRNAVRLLPGTVAVSKTMAGTVAAPKKRAKRS